jgi:hypothetical protein
MSLLRPRASSQVTPEAPAQRIKNRHVDHDFEVTGGYDPEQDGDDPRWGRVAVKCSVCGEERRVACSPRELKLIGGCYRRGTAESWQRYDLLVTKGGALDEFVSYLDDGRVLTWNTMAYREYDRSELRPY